MLAYRSGKTASPAISVLSHETGSREKPLWLVMFGLDQNYKHDARRVA